MKTFLLISALLSSSFLCNLQAQRNPRQGWIEPTNQDFTMKVLAEKERRFKENSNQVISLHKEISLMIKIHLKNGVSDSQNSYISKYLDAIEKINAGNYDYGNSKITESVLNYLQQFYDEIDSW